MEKERGKRYEYGERERKEMSMEKEGGKRYEYGERERKEMSMEIETENI